MTSADLLLLEQIGVLNSGGAAWTPAELTGVSLWLASDTGYYQDSALTTPATSNNDPVGGWVNQVTGADDALQATAADRLTLKTNVANGYPALESDGVSDFLAGANIGVTGGGGFTLFVVLKPLAIVSDERFFDFGANVAAQHVAIDVDSVYRFDNGNRAFTEKMTTAAFFIATMYSDDNAQYGAHEMRLNGTLSTEASSANPTNTRNLTAENYQIGIGLNGSSRANVQYAEIILCAGLLGADEIAQAESYLSDKFNISI